MHHYVEHHTYEGDVLCVEKNDEGAVHCKINPEDREERNANAIYIDSRDGRGEKVHEAQKRAERHDGHYNVFTNNCQHVVVGEMDGNLERRPRFGFKCDESKLKELKE